ncbi:hypothetical protein [Arcticibacterium luteifluviistationis]|uniref:ABC transporter permease n=1 Tax=Arcticibacterium luteifluviistationis TaxID=1784714 RepID=A0A2Z4GH88_9BACT|nr:hypothetical protein [Arcticibacterium luteifluviistationis]AWW00289.1 hypothetical protein DJ013_19775 [Arcticibacterium luteifluviistationis]
MSNFFTLLKWQFLLLHKNSIITISFAVTLIYGVILFFFKDMAVLDKLLVTLVLNDPSIIGFFFIALGIYTEIKHQILPAIFVTPVNLHALIMSKVLSISIVGVVCSLGLAISVKGFSFDIVSYTAGSFGICVLSSLLGLYMLTYATDFLKFTLTSVPIFLLFINVPMLQYLEGIDIGFTKYFFPIQGSVDLIDAAISGTSINYWYGYFSIILMLPVFYVFAYTRFKKKVVQR